MYNGTPQGFPDIDWECYERLLERHNGSSESRRMSRNCSSNLVQRRCASGGLARKEGKRWANEIFQ